MKGSAGPQRLAKSETYALFASAVVKQLTMWIGMRIALAPDGSRGHVSMLERPSR